MCLTGFDYSWGLRQAQVLCRELVEVPDVSLSSNLKLRSVTLVLFLPNAVQSLLDGYHANKWWLMKVFAKTSEGFLMLSLIHI